MRLAALSLVILMLSGCDDRSSFDKQYDDMANKIDNRAARIETDLNSTTSEADIAPEPVL